MKQLIALAIILAGCTTAQISQTRSIADPVVLAAVSGYAQSYGVPPVLTSSIVTPIQNQLWGMLAQANAQQPIAQGSSIPAVGTSVAQAVAANPNILNTTQLTNALAALAAIKK